MILPLEKVRHPAQTQSEMLVIEVISSKHRKMSSKAKSLSLNMISWNRGKVIASIALTNPNFTSSKRKILSKGVAKIARTLARVVNYQTVVHGFSRIGAYPLSTSKCLENCDKKVLEEFSKETIDNIIVHMLELQNRFVEVGQITEAEMHAFGIPVISSNDKRKAPKDQRTQCQQRAVLLSNPESRKRRREWIDGHRRPRQA